MTYDRSALKISCFNSTHQWIHCNHEGQIVVSIPQLHNIHHTSSPYRRVVGSLLCVVHKGYISCHQKLITSPVGATSPEQNQFFVRRLESHWAPYTPPIPFRYRELTVKTQRWVYCNSYDNTDKSQCMDTEMQEKDKDITYSDVICSWQWHGSSTLRHVYRDGIIHDFCFSWLWSICKQWCQNQVGTGPMLLASGRCRSGSCILRHVYKDDIIQTLMFTSCNTYQIDNDLIPNVCVE